MDRLLPIVNGQAVRLAELPDLPFARFQEALLAVASRGGAVVQLFGYENDDAVRLLAVLRQEQQLLAATSTAPEEFPSLAAADWKFLQFEREIAEQFGLRPLGHPWLKPLRYHPNWRGVADVFGNHYQEDIPGRYPFFQVRGEGVHEVGVGPVHAGIIEPGHFRFQCVGEQVLHLEIQLGYQHRGIERLLARCPDARKPHLVEGVAGDTVVAHGLCFAQAVETLSGTPCPAEASVVRTAALELERLANHVGDLGALAGDVAFAPPAAFFGRLRGEFLNLLLALSGNRFGKGLVRPAGLAVSFPKRVRQHFQATLAALRPEITQLADLLFTAHTVLSRFEGCGVVKREEADRLGLVGVAARASGLEYDARAQLPSERYAELPACMHTQARGDVFSRAWIRYEEILHSLEVISLLLDSLEEEVKVTAVPTATLAADAMVVCVNEAWRGELSHCLVTDASGAIRRYKIKDPSFHNWLGLSAAMRTQGISDFPLINKSFNLSYCGFDL